MEVKWYCRGEVGEYILDQVENVIDGIITNDEFVVKLERLGLSAGEIRELMVEEEMY